MREAGAVQVRCNVLGKGAGNERATCHTKKGARSAIGLAQQDNPANPEAS